MKKPTDQEVLERAEKEFPLCKEYWERHHQRFNNIKRFTKCHGQYGQWDEQSYRSRAGENPPRLTLSENLLGPFVMQVANDLKQSDFGASVKPKDSGADVKLAEVRQGLHRGVQQIGGWKRVLDQAIDDLIVGGLGAWRLITKSADNMSFRKEIEYCELEPTRLFHGDGSNRKSDFSDVTDSFVYEPYSRQRFKAEFDQDPQSFLGSGNCNPLWGNGKTPWVTDYFFIEETPATLVQYQNKPYLMADFKKLVASQAEQLDVKPETLIDMDSDGDPITRETTTRQVWWAKLAAKKVLKLEAWPGYCIPNFLATGRKVSIDGEIAYYGLGEPAKDVQMAHNFAFSAMVERAGLAPKIKITAASESIPATQRDQWDNANLSSKMVLYYNAYTDDGQNLPPPQMWPTIQTDPAFATLRQMTEQGIRNVLGMWETSLGAQSNEKSGVAIKTRERQADTGNYDWGNNLAVAAEHCFQTTDELLSKVYDTPTQVRIVGEDDKEEVIWAASLKEGQQDDRYFDLNQGKYDILCKMAPSADTKRDEQSQGMELLFQGDPEMRAVMAPEYIALQPWKNAQKMSQIAASFRSLKFPGLQNPDQPVDPQQMQQHMTQMQQQLQAMQQQLQQSQQAVQEAQQLKIENASIKADKGIDGQRLMIEKFKADTDRILAEATVQEKQGKMLLASDELKHDQTLENAQMVQDVHAQAHKENHDKITVAITAGKQMHQGEMDHKNFAHTVDQAQKQNELAAQADEAAAGSAEE